ncbi:hypothetical protein PCL_10212 [Purpureocillium lilacinum]|uniref:Uncharacterized protein n=1 Tax=Purpureocillium lilacinum TaxID=33203 RepID=A0A2U3EF96_PURLI|nr:hypothetical protein PCL_10212 [Purpureocillium lilacinum]
MLLGPYSKPPSSNVPRAGFPEPEPRLQRCEVSRAAGATRGDGVQRIIPVLEDGMVSRGPDDNYKSPATASSTCLTHARQRVGATEKQNRFCDGANERGGPGSTNGGLEIKLDLPAAAPTGISGWGCQGCPRTPIKWSLMEDSRRIPWDGIILPQGPFSRPATCQRSEHCAAGCLSAARASSDQQYFVPEHNTHTSTESCSPEARLANRMYEPACHVL